MDITLISLITKSYLVLLIILLQACSQATGLLHLNKEKKKPLPKKKVEKVIDGPTSKGDGSFLDKTDLYGLRRVSATHFYAVDWNGDGYTDLATLPFFYSIPEFYQFNPIRAKYERLSYNPFPQYFKASYLVFSDFNGDHIPDVIVSVFNQKSSVEKEPLRLYLGEYENKKLKFSEVLGAFPAASDGPNSSITLLDYNLDGYLDVYVGQWFDVSGKRPEIVPDKFYQGGKNLHFKDVSFILKDELLYQKPQGYYMATPTMGVTSCDINLDGYPDIITSSTAGLPNKLWLNVRFPSGGRAYQDFGKSSNFDQDKIGRMLQKQGGDSLFAHCLDYNNDQLMDIITGELSHSYDPEYRDRSSILTGAYPNKVEFLRSEYYRDDGTSSWNQADYRAVSGDLNNDGLIDFIVDNSGFPPKSRMITFFQEHNHAYSDVATKLGLDILNPSGTILFDVNRDNKLDIISGHSNIRKANISKRVYLFENQIQSDAKLYRVVLESGKHFNSEAVGATLKIFSNNRVQTRVMNRVSGGQSSQVERGAFFAIPKEEKLEKMTILWPYRDKKRKPIKTTIRKFSDQNKKFNNFKICFPDRIVNIDDVCKE